ncbi:hypothetical protein ACH5RR_031840 [Cinchona calisaya]|uniref:Uncharacterized protein n=1 Tax=Cinchona calisaya TaxID=153742 RepID=A0ABD2YGD6_9GENT
MATAAAASFDCIHSALKELDNSWALYDFAAEGINRFKADLMFLRTLYDVLKVFDLGQVGEETLALACKIEAAAEEIAQDLVRFYEGTKKLYSSSELFNVVMGCQTKTQDFINAEIRLVEASVVEQLFSFRKGKSPCPPPDHCFWTSFVDSVICNLWSIETDDGRKQVSALSKELELIRSYIIQVAVGQDHPPPPPPPPEFTAAADDNDAANGNDVQHPPPIIDAFLCHVASVFVSIAFQSCNYWWFNRNTDTIDKLVNLHHEIDPTKPEFMEFHLNFLKGINEMKIHQKYPTEPKVNFVVYFYNYLLTWKRERELKIELESLVNLLIDNKLDGSREDVQSFFAEINALLLEAASSFFGALRKGTQTEIEADPLVCSNLCTRICILRAEFFLKEQVSTFSMLFDKIHVGRLNDILGNLTRFSKNEESEFEKQSLALIKEVAKEVASVCQSFEAKKITESTVKNSLLRLLLKVVMFKAESVLMDWLKTSNPSTFLPYHAKDLIESLLERLKCFTLILTNQLMKDPEHVDLIFPQIEAFARAVTYLSYSFLPNKITEVMFEKMILSFSELLDKAMHIKAKLNQISPQFPLSDFPKTYKMGFINFLSRNLGELLEYDPESIAPLKHHIKEIQLHLESFSSILVKVSDWNIEHTELKDLGNDFIEVAYKIECVIDLIDFDAHWQHFFWFYNLLDELRLVDKQASRIYEKIRDENIQNVTQVSVDMISRGRTLAIDEIVVDLSDEEEVIVDRLTRGGSSKRDIVSIVGMPGMGKTTLARKVYNNSNVMQHFHRRAWCTVSQVYDTKELLLDILRDIHGVTSEAHRMSKEGLEEKLRQCLLRNKYLIVMDDVWDVGAWNGVKNSFPDDTRSRILITSRLRDVALEIEPNSDPHSIRPLSDDESWKLLGKKIFQGEGCPEELSLVGQEIARQCKGLPLAVVAISGLLKRTEKRKEWWEKIAESLSSEVMKDPEARCMEILELSYKHLPAYLKACFLYLGVFLEDKDIPVSKLLQFWLAEGFIQRTESKSSEDVAENYLMDLINRSLVIISKRRSNGKVKACRLHDLIRDLCQSKAKEDNFFQLVTRRDEPYASYPSLDYGFDLYFDRHVVPVTYMAYRLSIFLKRNHFVQSRPSGMGTRSLIYFASPDAEPRCPYDISFICHNFKFLRVLDFECINMGISFPVEIELLVQLRYLAVSGYVSSIPQSISKLRNLEILVVKGLRGLVVLPGTVWQMTSLRHLHVNNHVALNLDDEELGGCFQLENLVSFSIPSLSCGEDTENILKRLPNLCKLRCIFFESRDSPSNCNQFPRLNFLTHLESLNIFYYGSALSNSELILPFNLKKLTLSNFGLPWNHISGIGRLPNLQVLKLLSGAFEGQIWDMREEEFQELKFLKLDTLNITKWNASCYHLPKLQHLVVQNCKNLQKLPYDFADIMALEIVELLHCGQSAEKSAEEIGEATGEIKVLISRS